MGGAERQALYLVEHLTKLPGCSVEVLSFEDGSEIRQRLDALGVPVHVLPYYFRWPKAKRARRLARLAWMLRSRIKPDALLPFVGIHSKTMGLVWPYSGARFCWWNQQDEGRDLGGTPVEGRVLRKASCIISNSVTGKDFLSSTYALNPQTILVYNNGTPVPDATANGDWRRTLRLGARKIVSMIANLTAYKDHATLLESWVIVRQHFPVGGRPALLLAGSLDDRTTVANLKTRAFELGLSGEDIFFLGAVENVQELMLESDVVVHSSLTEGCPNAVCEAMALARPVVATDIPGCAQALGDAGSEWLTEPHSSSALAARMIKLLEDDELRRQVGASNRRRIAAEFSVESMNDFFQRKIEEGLRCSLA